jgi:hypothetical protein
LSYRKRRRKFRKRGAPRAAPLSIAQILGWADDLHKRTGQWPRADSGAVVGGIGEKWANVSQALRLGLRGLEGKSSLAQLLAERRGVRNRKRLPHFSPEQILAWADAFHDRHGKWPNSDSGAIAGAPGETWGAVETALVDGLRGLDGGSSLARFLARHPGVRNLRQLPRLSYRKIVAWADAFHRRTGKWPTSHTGPVDEAPGETWSGIRNAMKTGHRGLPRPGVSLGRLLQAQLGARNHLNLPRLSHGRILAWADAHRQRTGHWPRASSGPIAEAPGETWHGVNVAMTSGYRGLRAGYTLPQLLSDRRGVRNVQRLPRLSERQILAWADRFRRSHGAWPSMKSGPIPGTGNEETWMSVDTALRHGCRGFAPGSSLKRFLDKHRPG